MLGMVKVDKRTAEFALYLVTVSVIIRNSEGHNYQSEDTTGNSEHMLKSVTLKAPVHTYSTAIAQFSFSPIYRCIQL
jgi:hypothetical protein